MQILRFLLPTLLGPLVALAVGSACERRSSAESQVVRLSPTKISASGATSSTGPAQELLGGKAAAAAPKAAAGAEGAAAGPTPGGKNYDVVVTPPSGVKVGAQASAQVVLKPKNGYKVNLEFPIRLKVAPPAGVKLAKATMQRADAQVTEKQATFPVAFTVETAGAKAFSGEFHFSVCTPKFCEIKKEKLAWSVAAE